MQKDVKFQLEDAVEYPEWCDNYPEHKFTVFKCCFLSTKPNAHKLDISNDVLRRDAQSILGNMLVAKIQNGDATTHLPSEIQYGYFPREQEIEFVEEDGVTKAYAYAVVSKHYSKELNNIFEFDNLRNSSVEMTVTTDKDDDEGKVVALDIFGLTVLGKAINGSCPDADIKMVRFSTEDADAYFAKSDSLSNLKQFVEERKQSMAEKKTYKIDKSKEAMSTADWGDYDKAAMRDKIMEAKNRDTLVKSVYLLVEDGWKDAPSEHLKYPVMMLDGDTFIYNRNALSSALAYAKQNDETEVVNKIEAIYKKLDLDDDSERKEDKKMAEIEFSAVNIGDLWGMLWAAIEERQNWEYGIQGIYEEDNQKFAIVTDRAKTMYRLDFSLTEDGLTLADEVVEVKQEFTETDNIKRFAEPENVAEYRLADCDDCDEHDHDDDDEDEHEEHQEMSADEMKAKMAELEKDIESRDNIIMGKDAELEELRKFKAEVEEQRKAATVESIMAECKEYMSDEQYKEMREEGMACNMAEIDGWTNKVKAVSFSAVKKNVKKNNDGVWRMAAPIEIKKKSGLWD